MRRLFVPVVGAAVAASLLLAACSQAAPAPAPTQAPAKAAEPAKAAAPAAQPPAAPAAAKPANWPQKGKTLQIIIHWAAGGANDVAARLLAPDLEKELGIPVEVVNKAGASGQVGMTALSQAKPDGYTIGSLNFPSAIVTVVDPERKASYTRQNFQPLAMHQMDPGAWAVKPNSPYKSVKDIVAAAKANPKTIKIGDSGMQSDDHFAIVDFQKQTGAQLAVVHFSEGNTPNYAAFLGGHLDIWAGNVGEIVPQHKSGEARVIGITGRERSKFLPDIPTFQEQGIDVVSYSTRGFGAPAGVPKDVVDYLSATLKKVMEQPDQLKKMDEMGLAVRYLPPDQFDKEWATAETKFKELLPLTREK